MARSNQEKEELIQKNERTRKYLAYYMLMGDNSFDDVCAVLDIPMDKYMLEKFLYGYLDVGENILNHILNLKVRYVDYGIDDLDPTEDELDDFIQILKAN